MKLNEIWVKDGENDGQLQNLCVGDGIGEEKTRPDTRLPKSRAGGQVPYLRPLHHLGRSSKAKDRKNPKKVKCDGRTDGRTDRRTDGPTDKAGCRVA